MDFGHVSCITVLSVYYFSVCLSTAIIVLLLLLGCHGDMLPVCLQANVLIVDLFEDLQDGFNLLTLLEVLSHQTFVRQQMLLL